MNPQERLERRIQYRRAVFDAIPLPAFIMDADVRVLDFNTAATPYFGPDPSLAIHRRAGEAWHCIHSAPEGCGRAEVCRDCVIRNSIHKAMSAKSTWRERHKVELREGRKVKNAEVLVTASLLPYADPPRALVLLEDVTEVIRLRELIPICCSCRQVRDDRGYWRNLERYLKQNLGAMFSESVCPDCAASHGIRPAAKARQRKTSRA